ncbi:Alpha/Beta hydrolase protein [Hysterangium stoloniferum]|nr:Alpha/Beta hydrolase protein [Hysterangium stoloniferum]
MFNIAAFISQEIAIIPLFTLECGTTLREVPVAYKTWGSLNETKNNVMIICHALTGSADVQDWWGPLMGPGKAFDFNRFFIFCANVMGSPYGSASPVCVNPDTGRPYGPEFPSTTIRDDVRLHKLVLDRLGVRSVAVVIGGSMGGMATLEWPLCTDPGYIRHIVPIATSPQHSAWCISWGEAQRQSIFADPAYDDGYYSESTQPKTGLAAARMAALLTYRSRDSFESRFGRRPQPGGPITPPGSTPTSPALSAVVFHNDGHRSAQARPSNGAISQNIEPPTHPTVFSAQGYLRYQGDKFTARFDANCYIHITRKMDTHDVSRGRFLAASDEATSVPKALAMEPSGALVIGIQSDGLFTPSEQLELSKHIPDAELVMIQSPDGHDGFLLEFEQINRHILLFLKKKFPEYYTGAIEGPATPEDFEVKQSSMFGEAEVDITRW